jgi:DNA-binding GntR family transcriptional regulator
MPWHALAPPDIPCLPHPGHVLQLPDLDPSGPAPYKQVAGFIADAIRSGAYSPGDRLPSIVGLGQRYGIARRTASKALGLLVDQGVARYEEGMGHFATGAPRGTSGAHDPDRP